MGSDLGKRLAHGRAPGFTLLELLVAVAMFGIVATVIYGTFTRTLDARAAIDAGAEEFGALRAGVEWLSRDLKGSFSAGLYPTGAKRFLSTGLAREDTRGTAPLLDVTTVSALGLPSLVHSPPDPSRPAGKGDQIRVLYHLERSDDDGGDGFLLVRYELRPPLESDLEHARRAIVARGIGEIRLRFFDGSRWYDRWDSIAAGPPQAGTPPRAVEIRIRAARSAAELVAGVYLPLAKRRG